MKDQWIEWFEGNRRKFFYGVSLVVAFFFVAFQTIQIFQKPAPSNYFTAHHAFEKWIMHDSDFEALKAALATHPELETKFGALIADKFIARNRADKATPFADAVLERVLKQTPNHAAYAKGSQLISQGKLSEALSHSLQLRTQLEKNSLLYGFNLLRIASLTRAIGSQAEELASLEELEEFMAGNPEAKKILESTFSEGENTLSHYIDTQRSIR